MNLQQVMSMSKESLRIEIAKLQGWSHVKFLPVSETVMGIREGETLPSIVPDYPNSIQASYELEGMIPEDKQEKYMDNLWDVIRGDGSFLVGRWRFYRSTPHQKSMAFYLTMEVQ